MGALRGSRRHVRFIGLSLVIPIAQKGARAGARVRPVGATASARNPEGSAGWPAGVFPTAALARGAWLLPPGSGRREAARRAATRLLDAGVGTAAAMRRVERQAEAAARAAQRTEVLALAVYAPDGAHDMAAATGELRRSRHEVRLALGAMGRATPPLRPDTGREQMTGGKFANLNELLGEVEELPEWLLVLDDDVRLPRGFLDRLIGVAQALALDLCQPALTWHSHGAWRVTRRRPVLARRTRFVEIGPVTLMRRRVAEVVTPFSEAGMGWGQCLHWGALAERHGWRLGIIDAAPVRHDRRRTASAYGEAEALAAARAYLAEHEHISYARASETLESIRSL